MKSPQIIIATNAITTNDGDLGTKKAKKQRPCLPTTFVIQGINILASSFIISDDRQQLISLLLSIAFSQNILVQFFSILSCRRHLNLGS